MLKTFKNKLIILIAALTLTAPAIIPLQASAATCTGNPIATNVGSGVDQATGASPNTTCGATEGSLTPGISAIAKKVVNIFSILVGIISIIMIIYAGFRYITSGGESGNVTNAKNTLIFAIVGLVIVVLAQLIVHYVLSTASTITSTPAGT